MGILLVYDVTDERSFNSKFPPVLGCGVMRMGKRKGTEANDE